MKNYKKVLASACAVLCLAAFTACTSKSEKVLEYIDSGDYSAALDYYEDKIDGNSKERDLRKEIKKGMKKRYEDVLDKFNKNEISEKEMEKFFELMKEIKLDDSDDDYSEFYSKYRRIVSAKEYFNMGIELFEEGEYEDAIYYLEDIEEDDGNYAAAQAKIEEAKNAIADEKLQSVQEYIDDKNYSRALDYLRNYESELKDNEKFIKIKEEAEKGLVSTVKEKIEGYFEVGEYYDAYYYITDYTYYDIKDINDMYDNLEDNFVDYVVSAAEKKASSDDYEGAVKLLQSAVKEVGEKDKLADALNEYKVYIPTYITDIDYMSITGSLYTSDKRDNTGNTHESAMKVDGWGMDEYFVEYLLDGNYNILSGQVGVSYNQRSSSDNKYFEIYGDDKLLYTSPTMAKDVLPQDFVIDVTGVKILKIFYPSTEGDNSLATIYDALIYKGDTAGVEFTSSAPAEPETEPASEEETTGEEETTTVAEEETTETETTEAASSETTTKAE